MTENSHDKFRAPAGMTKSSRWPRLLAVLLAGFCLQPAQWKPSPVMAQTPPRLSPGTDGISNTNSAERPYLIIGEPDRDYLIQASTDLSTWTTVTTVHTGSDGRGQFTDPESGGIIQRFYRAVLQNPAPANPSPAFRTDRILVKPKAGIVLASPGLLSGSAVLSVFPAMGNLQVVRLPAGVTVLNALASLRQSASVEYAEPDFLVNALREPNDFRFQDGSQWSLKNTGQLGGKPGADIHAPAAWDISTSAGNVIVAVIDTGIRTTHEDLAANLWTNPTEIPGNGIDDDGNGYIDDVHGINAITNSGDPADDHGHGCHVSGIIGGSANNQVGVAGVCWSVQIMACKFLDSEGHGSVSDAIKCIDYAVTKGAKVINASWGTVDFNSSALKDAIASAGRANVIFVAAAGNSAEDNSVNPIYPASFPLDNIISVAATTRTDDLAFFSNYGATNVHLAAPGSPIFSCWGNSDTAYQYLDGTSMAAAHVSGAAVLCRARFPGENYRQIINRILAGTDPLPGLQGKCTSGGRLNLVKVLGATPPPPNPVLTITASDASAAEPSNTGAFTVTRSGDMSASLTINYTVGGTAANGVDYQSLPGKATIPAGSSSVTIPVNPIDDSTVEGSESVLLTLSTGGGYAIGSPNSATVTIADNDSPPPPPPTANFTANPTSGQAPLTVQFTDQSTGNTSTRDWNFGDGSAHASAQNVTHTFSNAGDYTVTLTVTGPGGSSNKSMNIHVTAPPLPTVTITATDPNAAEPNDTGTFTVTRTGGTSTPLTVNYSIGGTAVNGTDYQRLSGTVSIPAGSGSVTIAVIPIDDTAAESSETLVLTLAQNAAYTVGSPGSATVTMADNDQPPGTKATVTVVATKPNASESGAIGVFTLSRSGSTAGALTVYYSLGGNAQNGVDYQTLPGSVTFPAGASTVDVKVIPIDDSIPEVALPTIDEPVYLMLSANSAYVNGDPNYAIVYIADNDQVPLTPTVTVMATDPNASESGDPGVFTVSRTGGTTAPLTVYYTMGGNAQNGVDYQALAGSVSIPAGAASVQVVVRPIADLIKEIDEPVYLMLSGNANYAVGTPDGSGRYAIVTIKDSN